MCRDCFWCLMSTVRKLCQSCKEPRPRWFIAEGSRFIKSSLRLLKPNLTLKSMQELPWPPYMLLEICSNPSRPDDYKYFSVFLSFAFSQIPCISIVLLHQIVSPYHLHWHVAERFEPEHPSLNKLNLHLFSSRSLDFRSSGITLS